MIAGLRPSPWRTILLTELRMRSISSSSTSSFMCRCSACEKDSWSRMRARASHESSITMTPEFASSRPSSERSPCCHLMTARGMARRSSCCARLRAALPPPTARKSRSKASSKLDSAPHHTLTHAELLSSSASFVPIKKKADAGGEPCAA